MKEDKKCPGCKLIKPLNAFSKRKGSADGLQSRCIDCRRIERKKYTEAERLRSQRRSKTPEMKAYQNARQRTPKGRERARKKSMRMYHRHKGKWQARAAVRYEVKTGRMPHPRTLACVECGEPACDYHHHKGYDAEHWLDVVPVCKPCHGKLH